MLHLLLYCSSAIVPFALIADSSQNDLRELRTGPQWLRALTAYLDFKTGDSWRRLSDPAQRRDPDRVWYLDGLTFLQNLLRDESGRSPSPSAHWKQKPIACASQSSASNRGAELSDALLRLDSRLTDRKLLSRLPKPKLARMVVEAQNKQSRVSRRAA